MNWIIKTSIIFIKLNPNYSYLSVIRPESILSYYTWYNHIFFPRHRHTMLAASRSGMLINPPLTFYPFVIHFNYYYLLYMYSSIYKFYYTHKMYIVLIIILHTSCIGRNKQRNMPTLKHDFNLAPHTKKFTHFLPIYHAN